MVPPSVPARGVRPGVAARHDPFTITFAEIPTLGARAMDWQEEAAP